MERSHRLGKLNIAVVAGILLVLALVVVLAGSGNDKAAASTGGIGLASSKKSQARTSSSLVRGARLGARTLREGMSGPDVKVLNSIVRFKNFLSGAATPTFSRPTTSAVRRFQNSADMASSGVVNKTTARALIGSLHTSEASWYGPGLYGNGTACGKVTLRPTTIGLANKNLPCGTRVLIGYRGKFIIAPVIDRGPYGPGRTWDLTKAAADAVGLTSAGVGRVRHAILSRGY
ncbi:MAG TPA: RlpA-like double-psi beta-barrel domain-containing protein [Solirubrobacterales bacterium]|jgi:rare lipoprotein A (peptidoglycan hydrolase)|nr:peptidoglycan-binding protein [Solirubrobacterales bacterium]HMU28155.1 RlpA-like double-psi beta-barrel domain-containing protein [Solirubrobacterales bacterium]HMX72378.1 RlpA-like double-psi beta-barrel domain-containing protein [Solirubrobacterales bacterium]HMY25632.1 RlpA-like double-psi beta-barrel domain-containing protein [Solirubrobacterales bacterium]HNA24981.1 RlpA-like double-psi beta-barrel domain-containing protein [Solirubrobacterales bacterium]